MLFLDETWIHNEEEILQETYFDLYKDYIDNLPRFQRRKELVSGMNRLNRCQLWSSDDLQIDVARGDICFMDFGQVYINEAGYQHFGLVISKFNHKLFVVPMTSNTSVIKKAQSDVGEHLFYIGKLSGLNKPSVLFLNDCKFVNSSRIISVNSHLCPESKMFKAIESELKCTIFHKV